ncbi:MAG: hypothetical protein ACREOZ_01115 [Gloeomargaritales cyanobacterium]
MPRDLKKNEIGRFYVADAPEDVETGKAKVIQVIYNNSKIRDDNDYLTSAERESILKIKNQTIKEYLAMHGVNAVYRILWMKRLSKRLREHTSK